MGNAASHLGSLFKNDPDGFLDSKIYQKSKKDFEALGFDEDDVLKLYKVFRRLDLDNSGKIDVLELITFLHMEKTKFSKKIFQMLDDDNSGEIDFYEFTISIWNFCSVSKMEFVNLVFDIYSNSGKDNDDGAVYCNTLPTMMEDLYGSTFHTNNQAKKVLREVNSLNLVQEYLCRADFIEFCNKHKALTFPGFVIQSKVQEHVLGPRYWKKMTTYRSTLCKGFYLPTASVLILGRKMQRRIRRERERQERARLFPDEENFHNMDGDDDSDNSEDSNADCEKTVPQKLGGRKSRYRRARSKSEGDISTLMRKKYSDKSETSSKKTATDHDLDSPQDDGHVSRLEANRRSRRKSSLTGALAMPTSPSKIHIEPVRFKDDQGLGGLNSSSTASPTTHGSSSSATGSPCRKKGRRHSTGGLISPETATSLSPGRDDVKKNRRMSELVL